MLVDTHTADGLFVAQAHREESEPMICLETALPAKFADAIREATGIDPEPPVGFAGLEERVQRYARMPVDVKALKRYIAARCLPSSR